MKPSVALSKEHPARTITEKQLAGRLNRLEALLTPIPISPADIARRLIELSRIADTTADLARTMSEERGSDASRAVVTWTEALAACIRSHRQDLELLAPWVFLLSAGDNEDSFHQARNPRKV